MVDAQLDELQINALRITFDPLDVGEEVLSMGAAWRMCRQEKSSKSFRYFQWWGYGY